MRSLITPEERALQRHEQTEGSRASKRPTPREKALKELLYYKDGKIVTVRIGSIIYFRDSVGDIWMENVKTGERKKMEVWDSM